MLSTALKWLGGWRIYALLGLVFGGYILSLKTQTWNAERKLTAAIEKITKLKKEAKEAENANKTTNESLTECEDINHEITRQGDFIKSENDKAIKENNNYSRLQDEKIIKLQNKLKADNICDDMFISNDNIKLFKKANNQD